MEREKLCFLARLPLFRGFCEDALAALLAAAGAGEQRYEKGETAILRGEENRRIGVVLEGQLVGELVTAEGALTALHELGAGAVFGDVLSGSSGVSPVTVRASRPSRVLWLSLAAMLSPAGGQTDFKALFLRNFIEEISDKYFALSARVSLLSERRLRSRIARYFLSLGAVAGDAFTLPQRTRAELAAYLACERSALSRELSRMAADGLIAFRKDRVVLRDPAALERL